MDRQFETRRASGAARAAFGAANQLPEDSSDIENDFQSQAI
jgi:hypothetical protein